MTLKSGIIRNDHGRCEYAFEDDFVHIYNLFVFPNYRGQGRAREILQTAINVIRSTGYTGAIQIVASPEAEDVNVEKLKLFYTGMGLDVYSYYG